MSEEMKTKLIVWSGMFIAAALLGVTLFALITSMETTTSYTGHVDKLWQESSQSYVNDYVRVTTTNGRVMVYSAYPEVWGLLEEGQTCQFEVRDNSGRAVNAVCKAGKK